MVCSLSTLQNELGRRNLKLDAVRHCAGMPCHIYLFICIFFFENNFDFDIFVVNCNTSNGCLNSLPFV